MAKAWRQLEDFSPARCGTAAEDAQLRLNGALAAVRQLLARPDTRTEDLLEYLADLEAATQLLAALAAGSNDGIRRDHTTGYSSRSEVAKPSASPSLTPGSFSTLQETHATPRGAGMQQLQLFEWEEFQEEETETHARLANLAAEAEALAQAQFEVASLANDSGNLLAASFEHVAQAASSTGEAVAEVAAAARIPVRSLPLRASLGGAALGAAVGVCLAGPVGAAVGASTTAAVGALGGSAAKKRHLQAIDRVANSAKPASCS